MAYPKMKPCAKCGDDGDVGVCTYDSGWSYVECDECHYVGPAAGNKRDAIKLHNERMAKPSDAASNQQVAS